MIDLSNLNKDDEYNDKMCKIENGIKMMDGVEEVDVGIGYED